MKIKSPKDFWSGLMFVASGLFFAIWAITHYQMGTAVRMGPAYFPAMLGGLLVVLGAMIFIGSLVIQGATIVGFNANPLTTTTISLNGGTTGGAVGSILSLQAVAAGKWLLRDANLVGVGAPATPFS